MYSVIQEHVKSITPGTQEANVPQSSSLAVHTRGAFLCASQQAILPLCSFVIARRADL